MSSSWEKIAAQKRESILSQIPREWIIQNPPSRQEQRDVTGAYIHQFLTKEEIEITETDAVGIAAHTTTGQWKAVDVAKAFCHRAALAHQLTNCLLEIFFTQAIERAQQLDDYFAKNKKPLGPLHGVPVSLKDQFHVKGVETTMGYVGWVGTFQGVKGTGKERQFESELVKELLAAGAILFCKTSVPHTLMAGESENHISGYVWNPKNRLLSAGGSSGGEGALVGIRGSPLGVGSDIGGSVRIPSAFNGLYGLRPSTCRIPYEGAANSMDGQNTVLSTLGPIATSPGALQLAMRAIMSQKPWLHDPMVLEIPWRDEEELEMRKILTAKGAAGKLAFGLQRNNGRVQPHPPVRRAVDMLVHVLQKLGHEIIEWDPVPNHKYLVDKIAIPAWLSDGGVDVHGALGLSGEPPVEMIEFMYGKAPGAEVGAAAIAKLNITKRDAQKAYMEYWNSTVNKTTTGRPVDALITPVAPFAAAPVSTFKHLAYSVWVNAVDYTAVIIPVTKVDKNIDVRDADFKAFEEEDLVNHELYDPELFDGSHVSVQLVGRRLQEEKMLAIAAYIDEALAANK